jgi:hypothetical protein
MAPYFMQQSLNGTGDDDSHTDSDGEAVYYGMPRETPVREKGSDIAMLL